MKKILIRTLAGFPAICSGLSAVIFLTISITISFHFIIMTIMNIVMMLFSLLSYENLKEMLYERILG